MARIDSPWGLQESQKILAVPRFLIRWLLQKQRRDWHEVSNKRLVIAWTRSRAVAVPYTVTNNIPMRPSPSHRHGGFQQADTLSEGGEFGLCDDLRATTAGQLRGLEMIKYRRTQELNWTFQNGTSQQPAFTSASLYERLFSDMAWSTTETLALSGTQLPYLVSNSH